MEVVVADVVRGDLVVPSQRPGLRVGHDEGVGVEDRAGVGAAVRSLARSAPRSRVRDAPEDVVPVDARCVPRAAAAGLERVAPRVLDRVEPPDRPARATVERVQRAAAARREADRRSEDPVAGDLRRDVDEVFDVGEDAARPDGVAVGGVEREDRLVGDAVDAIALDREPVRARVAEADVVPPAQAPVVEAECVDVAPHVLDVHRLVGHDGRRRQRAGRVRWIDRDRVAPRRAQRRDGVAVDGARRRAPRRREVVIGARPLGGFVAPAAGECDREQEGEDRTTAHGAQGRTLAGGATRHQWGSSTV